MLNFVEMKSVYRHTNKLSKGERLGWKLVKERTEVSLTRDMLDARVVALPAVEKNTTNSSRNLLVP
jgi:hypothetical protein